MVPYSPQPGPLAYWTSCLLPLDLILYEAICQHGVGVTSFASWFEKELLKISSMKKTTLERHKDTVWVTNSLIVEYTISTGLEHAYLVLKVAFEVLFLLSLAPLVYYEFGTHFSRSRN